MSRITLAPLPNFPSLSGKVWCVLSLESDRTALVVTRSFGYSKIRSPLLRSFATPPLVEVTTTGRQFRPRDPNNATISPPELNAISRYYDRLITFVPSGSDAPFDRIAGFLPAQTGRRISSAPRQRISLGETYYVDGSLVQEMPFPCIQGAADEVYLARNSTQELDKRFKWGNASTGLAEFVTLVGLPHPNVLQSLLCVMDARTVALGFKGIQGRQKPEKSVSGQLVYSQLGQYPAACSGEVF